MLRVVYAFEAMCRSFVPIEMSDIRFRAWLLVNPIFYEITKISRKIKLICSPFYCVRIFERGSS